MKLFVEVFSKEEEFGVFPYEANQRKKIRDLERFITKDIAGDEFRRITLIEDFMRSIFSNPLTIPLKICDDTKILAAVQEHGKIRLNFLFEREPLVFRISFEDPKKEKADFEEIKKRMYSSGHYVGMYTTPDLDIDDLTEFVNKRKRLLDISDIPESAELSFRMKRKEFKKTYPKDTPFLDVALDAFKEFGLEEDVFFRVYKGKKDECLLMMEYPPYAVFDGFSYTLLGEIMKAFKGELVIDYDDEKEIIVTSI